MGSLCGGSGHFIAHPVLAIIASFLAKAKDAGDTGEWLVVPQQKQHQDLIGSRSVLKCPPGRRSCVLCSLGLLGQAGGSKAKFSLHGQRTHVVLAGHDLRLKFTVPQNTTAAMLECYHGDHRHVTTLYNPLSSNLGEVVLLLNHSSESGEYHCKHSHAGNVYLAILVRDEGFTETYHGLRDEVVAPVSAVTVLLLIFSVVGSIYIYKSQTAEGGQGGGGVSVAGGRTSHGEDSGEQEGEDEEGGANSVYTTLESRPASIYEVLDRSVSSSRTQSKKSSRRRSKKKEEAASGEDGIFESVYENV
ncbi:hypothetical protein ACEWY4_017603 [Coilia grayii]|uniref:Immunoglobulin subtype domain-containing protein n=1 Tax=Coilia grayii TaxID=363190 RepID=A0ABD1JIH0_9TELE